MDTIKIMIFPMYRTQIVHDYHPKPSTILIFAIFIYNYIRALNIEYDA